jgi:hypothetical protein
VLKGEAGENARLLSAVGAAGVLLAATRYEERPCKTGGFQV